MTFTPQVPEEPSNKIRIQSSTASQPSDNHRITPHTHIRGLGLEQDGRAPEISAGFVGQCAAREAAGLVVDLVRSRRMAGRAVLLAGPSGTGKTAIALAMAHELGPKVPFCPIVGSEVYSREVKKAEVLQEAVRRAIGLRVKETKEVFEGEVIELLAHEAGSSPNSPNPAISHITLTLKAQKGTKTLRLDPSIHEPLKKARVRAGDVIFIEANSGAVKRLGRSDAYKAEHDLEAEEYVPVPKGDVHKKREVIQEVTLHDLDMANTRPQAGSDVISLLGSMMRNKRSEVTDKLRSEVNRVVDGYIEQGAAELIPGILFIDEAHMLDLESFSYLNRLIESNVAPIIVLATNRMGEFPVRSSDGSLTGMFGIPRDLLDRLLIIRTIPYTLEQLNAILTVRAKTEHVSLSKEAVDALAQIGSSTSLRYAAQLITPSLIAARSRGHDAEVRPEDIEDTRSLFLDPQRSASLLVDPSYL